MRVAGGAGVICIWSRFSVCRGRLVVWSHEMVVERVFVAKTADFTPFWQHSLGLGIRKAG